MSTAKKENLWFIKDGPLQAGDCEQLGSQAL